MMFFVDDKFCKATVYITPKLEAYTIQTYREIQSEINSKYFITKDDFEIYDEPYEKNGGYTESGINIGKVSFSSCWSFQDANNGLENFISFENL